MAKMITCTSMDVQSSRARSRLRVKVMRMPAKIPAAIMAMSVKPCI